MAPPSSSSTDDSHQQLLEQLDISRLPKPFRNPSWKPPQRRNKTLKQILSDASRKEASLLATQNNSGSSTPLPRTTTGAGGLNGARTPAPGGTATTSSNLSQAAQSLSTLVLQRNGQLPPPAAPSANPLAPTYTNIESAPSLHPAHQRHYCDITGLPAPYKDPKTRLRYHDKEIFGVIRSLGQSTAESYLEARGAHTVLK